MKELGSYIYVVEGPDGRVMNAITRLYECPICYAATASPEEHSEYHA